MTDKTPSQPDAQRPTGKRQLSGAQTASTSTAAYEAKRASTPEPDDDKPGGGVAAFPGEVVQEMRKVVWPTGREMVNYTTIVFAFLIIMTALVWGVDWLASRGVEAVLVP